MCTVCTACTDRMVCTVFTVCTVCAHVQYVQYVQYVRMYYQVYQIYTQHIDKHCQFLPQRALFKKGWLFSFDELGVPATGCTDLCPTRQIPIN